MPPNCIAVRRLTTIYKEKLHRQNSIGYNADGVLVCRDYPTAFIKRLLSLHGSVQERHNLTASAVVAGTEQTAADTASDIRLFSPDNGIGIICVRCNISKCAAAADRRRTRCAIEEGHSLLTGAGSVRAEPVAARATGDTVFHSPCNRLGIVAVSRNIGKAARALGGGRTCCTPQEGYNLRAGAGGVGAEVCGVRARGDAFLGRPQNSIMEVVIALDIGERLSRNGRFLYEATCNGNIAVWHGECILAVHFRKLYAVSVLIQNTKSNIITLCHVCHKQVHRGNLDLIKF